MKIELSETEIIHIMDSLRLRVQDLRDPALRGCPETADLANELEELEHDLFEALARPGDWTEDVEPTEIDEDLWVQSAEDQMFQAGIDAREQAKESSHAATRRQQLLDSETRIFSASVVIDQLSRAPANEESDSRPKRFGEFELNGSASMAVHKQIPRTARRFRETEQKQLSDTQRHDLWDRPNDPTKW